MPRKTHLVILLVLLGVVVAQAEPKLIVTETEFNYGKVAQQSELSHGFWLKSVGDDTVRILEVFPGCGCTQIPLPDSTLAPGDSLELEIILNTERFFGFVTKKPYIEINRPEDKLVHFHIYAQVLPHPETDSPLVLEPSQLDVSQFSVKPRRRSTFTITNKTDETFDLALIDVSTPMFTVDLPDKIGPHETVKAQVIVGKDSIEESFRESFTFEATSSTQRVRHSLAVHRLYRPKDAGGQ